jgi:hypothetical protein
MDMKKEMETMMAEMEAMQARMEKMQGDMSKSMSADLDQFFLIHEVNKGSKVACVSTKTIGGPGDDRIILTGSYFVHHLVEKWPTTAFFSRMTLF